MSNIDVSQKVDLLWKKALFGVSQTGVDKSVYEELSHSPNSIRATEIWREDDKILIPAQAVSEVVEQVSLRLVPEQNSIDGSVWVAVRAFASGITAENRLKDFISPRVDPSFEVQIYSDSARTQRILNSKIQTTWVFDYESGILWLPNADAETPLTEVYLDGFRYIGEKGMNPTFSGDVIDVLGPLENGNFNDGYVPNFQSGVTKISEAINSINIAVKDFIPASPPPLSEQYMVVPGATNTVDDANLVLAEGFTDASGTFPVKPVAGNVVPKIVGMNVESSFVGPFGDGRQGTLAVMLNQESVGSRELSVGDDTGVYGKLYINQETTYGMAMASFWEVITAKAVGLEFAPGLNSLYLSHSITGDSNYVFLVNDSSAELPVVNSVGIRPINEVLVYSSGIPHYGRDTRLALSANVDNLATDLALDTRNVLFSTEGAFAGPAVWAYPGANGLPSVLTKATNYQVEDVIFNISDYDDTVEHGSVRITATGQNANGSNELQSTQIVNFMRGGSSQGMSPVNESGIAIVNLGAFDEGTPLDAMRISMPNGATPTWNGLLEAWDSTLELPAHEAAIVGGAIRFTRENYANYLPAGPDYSNKLSTQYATFAIQRRNVSLMNIEIEGKYSGLQIALPGLANQTLAPNGWMDCFSPYAGYGVPGREVPAGCALNRAATGGSQTVTATFGYESSSNSTNNVILVRFKLLQGDKITGLRFSGVSQ